MNPQIIQAIAADQVRERTERARQRRRARQARAAAAAAACEPGGRFYRLVMPRAAAPAIRFPR